MASRFESLRTFLGRHRHLVALGVFVLVIGGIYFSVLTGSRSLLTSGAFPPGPLFIGDPSAGGPITLPFERLAQAAWAHAQLPIVDPYQGYGIPLLADQGVPVYPLQLLAHALFPHNFSIWIVVNLIGLAFGSYLLASAFGQRFLAALAVGLAAALAGIAPPNLNMGMLNPLAVLPFVLVAIRFIVDPASGYRRSAWLGATTGVALLCLAGFQEVLPLFAVVILVYTVGMVLHFRTHRLRPGLIWSAALAGASGVVVGLVGLLPSLAIVRGHASLNAPGSYILHEPFSWLATLTVPTIAGPGIAAEPQQMGQTVWTLGTPILVTVLVLAVAIVLRNRGGNLRWYVWPSVAMVVYGVLGYANVLHVLELFDIPVLNSILTIRLLQFMWWIPWCLLLGAVISNVRLLRWYDAVVALVVTGLVDLWFVVKFRNSLKAHHLAQYLNVTKHATIKAAVIAVVFLVAVALWRWVGAPVATTALAAVVLGSCLYYLPTNFFPPSGETTPSAVRIPYGDQQADGLVYFNGAYTLPTTTYSVQAWGPIMPWPYQAMLLTLFPNDQSGGFSPLFDGVPTFGLVKPTPRLVNLLRSMGVDSLVTSTPLDPATFGPVPDCGTPAPPGGAQGICLLGSTQFVDGPPAPPGIAYAVLGASPLVQAGARPMAVPDNTTGLDTFLAKLTPTTSSLPDEAYVTSSGRRLSAASGVVGVSRQADTQSVTITLTAKTPGIVVLRAAHAGGMRATVDGRDTPALPVDGGLWTAVHVGSGQSVVVLHYASLAILAEFAIGGAGLGLLLLAWVVLAAVSARRSLLAKR